MFAQLQPLIALSELPHVTIQLMPFQAAGHAAAGGPIALLRLPEPELPDMVYLEQLTSALYPERRGDVDYYRDIMNRLATPADRPAPPPGQPAANPPGTVRHTSRVRQMTHPPRRSHGMV